MESVVHFFQLKHFQLLLCPYVTNLQHFNCIQGNVFHIFCCLYGLFICMQLNYQQHLVPNTTVLITILLLDPSHTQVILLETCFPHSGNLADKTEIKNLPV